MQGTGHYEIRLRVKWLMILRVTVVTVLLGSLAMLQLYQDRPPAKAVYYLIAATYFLTIVYALVYNKLRRLVLFAYIQIFIDTLLETGLIYATGGLDSAFSFTYIFSIIAAGIILYGRGGYLFASLSGILYGGLVDLQYYGLILASPSKSFSEGELFYDIFINFVAFFTVAFLSGSLSDRLRSAREDLDKKSTDLRELQALNESIVRSMADGMITVGLDGVITGLNKAGEEIIGSGAGNVVGRFFSEVFNWFGVEALFDDIEAAGKLPQRFEIAYERGGRDLLLGMTLSPLKNEAGDMAGLLGIFQDLTPIKEMERQIKKKDRLAAIGELSAGMAHEIRNPLASVSGSLQVLKDDLFLSDENRHLMDIALDEMDRLDNIVTQFLLFARPRTPDKEPCDLVTIVRDTADLIRNSKEFSERLTLETELPDHPLPLKADPGQLRQVIMNLSFNSVQAMSGTGLITIRAGKKDPMTVYVEVEDEGEGIPEEDIDRIFYPFYSTKSGGSGLGLAIVYRIIEEHEGNINVASERGRGTNITITFPAGGGPQ